MTQAIVNPDELRRFAQLLKKFNMEREERSVAITGQLETLSQSWRDVENRKFTEEFLQHMRTLARFVEMNNEHVPYLMRKADRIEEYLQQR